MTVMQAPLKRSRRVAAWFLTLLFFSLVSLGVGHHHTVSVLGALPSPTTAVRTAPRNPELGSELWAAPSQGDVPYDCPVCHWLTQPLLSPGSEIEVELCPASESLSVALPLGDVPVFVRFFARPGCRAPPLVPSS